MIKKIFRYLINLGPLFWGKVIPSVIIMLSNFAILVFMGSSNYVSYAVTFGVISMISSIFYSWLTLSNSRLYIDYYNNQDVESFNGTLFYFLGLIFLFVSFVGMFLVYIGKIDIYILIALMVYPISQTIFDIFSERLKYGSNQGDFLRLGIIRSSIYLILVTTIILLDLKITYIIIATGLSSMISLFICRNNIVDGISFNNLFINVRAVIKYGAPFILGFILASLVSQGDKIVISYFIGNSAIAAAYLFISDNFRQASNIVVSGIHSKHFPILNTIRQDRSKFLKEFKRFTYLAGQSIAATGLLFLPIIIFALIHFDISAVLIVIMFCLISLSTGSYMLTNYVLNSYLQIEMLSSTQIIFNFIGGILNLILGALGGFTGGILGMAAGFAFSQILTFAVLSTFIAKRIRRKVNT